MPLVVGGSLALATLTLVSGLHTNSLPGTFAEAETFVEEISTATDAARREGNSDELHTITRTARLAATARGASVLEVASQSDADAIRQSVFEVADAAERVAAGTAERSSLDAAMLGFLRNVGHLQDDLIQTDAVAFSRLRETTLTLVGVLVLGAAIAAGAMHYSDRAWELSRSKERAVAELVEEKNRELGELVRRDLLTGLLNRSALLAELSMPRSWVHDGSVVGVAYVDLDRFKVANDALGHHVGDALLVEVAQRMRRVWPEPERIARLGGDEFGLFMVAPTESSVTAAVERLVETFSEPISVEGFVLDVPASVGLAIGPEDGASAEVLLRHADLAMFAAKHAGGRTAFRFSDELDQAAADRSATESGLRIAVAHDEFRLVFQPIVRVADGSVVGVEALLRWDHPELGTLPPAEFIAVAEESGLISPIGEWVIEEALYQLGEWHRDGLDLAVAVNLSPRQLQLPGLAGWIRGLAARQGVRLESLIIEITESATLDVAGPLLDELAELRNLGVRIALDDFGMGYSSLGRFHQLPIDLVKIDRSFLAAISDTVTPSRSDTAVMEAAILLAHSHGLPIIAEGVETESERQLVERLGCDFAQGFFFARPMTASALATLLDREMRAA
ncbi:MAG: bifunctional diguanylate cyclase/phosphodiesterase [Dehalococcoidia bacterium]